MSIMSNPVKNDVSSMGAESWASQDYMIIRINVIFV